MSEGWVSIHRKILEWEWYSDINVCRLFIHLLLKVNHKEIRWQGKLIKKGQTLTSYNTLSTETGLTVKQIRTALDKLKGTGEVAVSRGYNYQVISITNYTEYQSEGRQSGSQRAGSGQSKGSQRATNNNENTVNNENNPLTPTGGFNFLFWNGIRIKNGGSLAVTKDELLYFDKHKEEGSKELVNWQKQLKTKQG